MENNTDFKNIRGTDFKNIKGWGIDANPENDPTYPMKKRTNEEHDGYSWERPPQQPVTVEVLHSNERPNVTAVFGTSSPPSGLSGKIRRYAFKYSESSYGHWLPLVLADRINVVEGIIDDLKHGHIPNIFAERGWTAEWKYNRQSFIKKAAAGVVITSALIALLVYRNKRSSSRRS
ncbi:hypothetical protein [Rubrolithibacter danxiaensis]|uniref:hypothetical protein n=1 Tax=Rubrolithibacter danxiaensis TaxID=3390805 RepID=UPI003BF8A690